MGRLWVNREIIGFYLKPFSRVGHGLYITIKLVNCPVSGRGGRNPAIFLLTVTLLAAMSLFRCSVYFWMNVRDIWIGGMYVNTIWVNSISLSLVFNWYTA